MGLEPHVAFDWHSDRGASPGRLGFKEGTSTGAVSGGWRFAPSGSLQTDTRTRKVRLTWS